MKKGIVQIIPLAVIAIVISLTTIGSVGKVRSTDSSNVLSSSNANTQNKSGGVKGSDKKQENASSNSQKSDSTGQGSKSNQNSQENKNLKDTDVNLEDIETDQLDELEAEVNDRDSDDNLTATPSGRKIRTNFPITVNPLTNEKIVTTPSGIKVIILPEVAIQNMIKAGFPVVLPEPSPEPSTTPSPEGTPSATPSASPEVVPDGEIVLTELNNELVYEIPAIKKQKFLAFLPVDVKITGIVSAESGNIIKINKSLFDQILDLLSF